MFRSKALMAGPHGQGLRCLQQAAGALGVFLQVHRRLPSTRPINGAARLVFRPALDEAPASVHMVRPFRHARGRMATVAGLYRYPIKGLSATPLTEIDLAIGQSVPFDRAFALAHGSTQFDPLKPQYLSPSSFFQLKRDERLAMLAASFDPETGMLVL